jgi:hypothetical protein
LKIVVRNSKGEVLNSKLGIEIVDSGGRRSVHQADFHAVSFDHPGTSELMEELKAENLRIPAKRIFQTFPNAT